MPPKGKCLVLINGAYGVRMAKLTAMMGRRVSTFETAEDVPTTPADVERLLEHLFGTARYALDKAVDAAYGYKAAATDAARVAFLFGRYQQLTSLLPATTAKARRLRKTAP